MAQPRIYRYIVRSDRGIAPNPYGGYCTLAICKPAIRRTARPSDWIIGFRSRRADVAAGRVVFVAQVAESLSFAEYWQDPRFRDRRPDRHRIPTDNIYRPAPSIDSGAERYVQVPNPAHGPASARRDLSGKRVLVATRFWYFGANSPPIDPELLHLAPVTQGHVLNRHRKSDDLRLLMQWLSAFPTGVQGEPVDWQGPPPPGGKRKTAC